MRSLRSLLGLDKADRDPPAEAAPTAAPASVFVQVYTASGEFSVEIERQGGERITELLNAEAELRARPAPPGPDPAAEPAAWTVVDRNEMLVVVPPPQPADRQRRLHRPGQQVRVQLGPYVVNGAAHVPPGVEATAFLFRHRQRFVPLTHATIRSLDGQLGDRAVPVAIVNVALAESLRASSEAE